MLYATVAGINLDASVSIRSILQIIQHIIVFHENPSI